MPWRRAGKEQRMSGELVRAAAARTGLLAALDLVRIPLPVLILAAVVAVLAILALVVLVAVGRTVRELRAAGSGGRRGSAEKRGSPPVAGLSRYRGPGGRLRGGLPGRAERPDPAR